MAIVKFHCLFLNNTIYNWKVLDDPWTRRLGTALHTVVHTLYGWWYWDVCVRLIPAWVRLGSCVRLAMLRPGKRGFYWRFTIKARSSQWNDVNKRKAKKHVLVFRNGMQKHGQSTESTLTKMRRKWLGRLWNMVAFNQRYTSFDFCFCLKRAHCLATKHTKNIFVFF